jgi:hypothetical protein
LSVRFADAIPVAAPPERVRAWWTQIDPATVVGRGPEGELRIRARLDGFRVEETFYQRADAFGFWTRAPLGLFVADEFRIAPAPGGSVVQVDCTVGCRNLVGRIAKPFCAAFARRRLMRLWRAMAAECARDCAPA